MLTLGIAWSFHTDPGDHMAKPLASRPTELGLQRTTRTCTELLQWQQFAGSG